MNVSDECVCDLATEILSDNFLGDSSQQNWSKDDMCFPVASWVLYSKTFISFPQHVYLSKLTFP